MELTRYLIECFLYILPVLAAGLFFIFTYKKPVFNFLDVGVSQKLFGRNKTWRGFLLMPAYCFVFVAVFHEFYSGQNPVFMPQNFYKALFLGVSYPLGELPNSFAKRRLGIAPGARPNKKNQAALFLILDNIDSVLSCCVCLILVYGLDPVYLPGILALGSLFHFSTDALMFKLKLKRC